MADIELERLRPEHWEAVHDWARLPEACRYQAWGPSTPEETRAFVTSTAAAWEADPQIRFPHVARVDGDVLGMGVIQIRGGQRQGEISYSVHPKAWGRGFATRIGSALLTFGFDELKLHRISGTCDPRNVASARVLQKLGMTYEGRLRHTTLIRDGWRDSEVFSILEDEWRARR